MCCSEANSVRIAHALPGTLQYANYLSKVGGFDDSNVLITEFPREMPRHSRSHPRESHLRLRQLGHASPKLRQRNAALRKGRPVLERRLASLTSLKHGNRMVVQPRMTSPPFVLDQSGTSRHT